LSVIAVVGSRSPIQVFGQESSFRFAGSYRLRDRPVKFCGEPVCHLLLSLASPSLLLGAGTPLTSVSPPIYVSLASSHFPSHLHCLATSLALHRPPSTKRVLSTYPHVFISGRQIGLALGGLCWGSTSWEEVSESNSIMSIGGHYR
jgi:hypothetical protein